MTLGRLSAPNAEFAHRFLPFLQRTRYTPSTWPRGSSMPQTVAAADPSSNSSIETAATHPLDQLSLGKIVQIRERLLAAQATGKRVYRFESGDPASPRRRTQSTP